MGAGSFGAGIGPAGFDPLITSPPETVSLPAGVEYSPDIRGFPFAADGGVSPSHPVDQFVALVCTIARGSLAVTPEDGINFERIRRSSPDELQAVITDEVRYALRDGLARGDLLFLGAPLLETDSDEVVWAVDYVNLRLPGQPARRFGGGP